MVVYKGGCFCKTIRFEVDLASPDDARMSICHCPNCKKFTGSAFGVTAKIPRAAFHVTSGAALTKHEGNNGSGSVLTREFCGACGSGILEYGASAGENVYLFYGSLDEPDALPPKGEFFTKYRAGWMPEVPGIFHKKEIKE
ncbi:Mss4-like protein [Schizophyllum fasciatum]